jgi:hypothetical protein
MIIVSWQNIKLIYKNQLLLCNTNKEVEFEIKTFMPPKMKYLGSNLTKYVEESVHLRNIAKLL